MFRSTKLVALVAAIATLTSAHSWVEEYQVISENGTYTGAAGYTRGYVPRTDPSFNGFSMLWLLPDAAARNADQTVRTRINASDYVCPPQQRTSNYTTSFPKLQVAPGDYVAMKYLENGHTTLPWNITGKPAAGGTVFVFGTTEPSEDETIANVMEWNTAGDGGDERGFLMAAQNFDDGRCHQINCASISQQRQMLTPNHVAGQNTSSVETWCESDVKIPETVSAGTLTVYWVWQWPTAPNIDCNTPAGKDEYYTSCADFDIVAAGLPQNANMAAVTGSAPAPAPTQSTAVADWKSRTAHTTSPSAILANNQKRSATPIHTAFASACTIQASIISAHNLGVWPQVYVPNTCSVVNTFGTAAASLAAAEFDRAASSYSAASTSAWEAAFAAANIPMQTPVVWSAAFETGSVAVSASVTTSNDAMTSAEASAPAMTSAAAMTSAVSTNSALPSGVPSETTVREVQTDYTTVVVVITSTLDPGVPIPTIRTVERRHPRKF